MDHQEARSILVRELGRYRAMAYFDLLALLNQTTHIDTNGPSGAKYQVDVEVMWDDKPKGALHVMGAIDDGGWRAFVPLTDSFIMRPDGSFVGE